MNLLLAIPLVIRLGGLFVFGACLGSLLNLGIYRLAWIQRLCSPWSPAPPKAAPRTWADRIPIYGWMRLQRESKIFGRGFWIRPMLIEFFMGVGIAWLYVWETVQQGLYGYYLGLPNPLPPAYAQIPESYLHWQFVAHVLLISLMVVATFIDIDEKTIPDAITVTGALLGLILAAAVPHSLPGQLFHWPVARTLGTKLEISEVVKRRVENSSLCHEVVNPASPAEFPDEVFGPRHWKSLCIGLGCYWLWCFAYAPRPWYMRHGLRRALSHSTARLMRSLRHPFMMSLIGLGTAGISALWWWGGDHWIGLITALVGMAASGGIVWLVRIIGAITLRKEAMGFGDVLLMMMIGAFIGWQGGIIVFFLAPGAGLIIGILQLLFRRDQYIPYGPFLCLATLVVIVYWAYVWNETKYLFDLGLFFPGILLVCMAAMALMLSVWRIIKEALLSRM